ncbi:MAG: TIGR00282 family metallophosphoesterase [Fusobacteria bacterium]|nr:TIGR00282 family metallophosphoesterase [Fusobacteriota bacterium]
MKILVFGDIVGRAGREAVYEYLKTHKTKYDLIIANGENSAGGFGLTNKVGDELFKIGIDVITGGNHIWDKRDIVYYMNKGLNLVRPLNYGVDVPGVGFVILERLGKKICVLNLQGRVFMPPIDCPFKEIKKWLEEFKSQFDILIVDIHAEATSEKIALGWYLDGEASLVFGTHTHVQTADEKISPKGTAYISDVGMCGSFDGILGMKKEAIIQKFLDNLPTRFEPDENDRGINAISVTIDNVTGHAFSIERIQMRNM